MEQTSLTIEKVFVRDLVDGQAVESVFLVRECSRRQKRNGEPFLKLQLADRSGCMEAVAWEEVEQFAAVAEPGAVVRATGRYAVDPRYGACLTIQGLRSADDGEYDPADLAEGPLVSYDKLAAGLAELIETIQRPPLR